MGISGGVPFIVLYCKKNCEEAGRILQLMSLREREIYIRRSPVPICLWSFHLPPSLSVSLSLSLSLSLSMSLSVSLSLPLLRDSSTQQ